MKYNFCTLFDSYYLTRGLTLYYSLETTCEDFHLYIFAFDDKCFSSLQSQNLRNATIISLDEFENEDLLKVKSSRTVAEYCWTCTPSTIWYSIKSFNLDHCTYLDADLMFFSSPTEIFKEIGRNSVGITPHNFSPKFKSSEIYGKYCVQFVYFLKDEDGLKLLDWWRKSCIDWCYAKLDGNKYGDQKYLEYFHQLSKNVCEITHPGAGVAPWNITNFEIKSESKNVNVTLKRNPSYKFPLIFYHYQGLKFKLKGSCIVAEPSITRIPKIALDKIYLPYILCLIKIKEQITGENYFHGNIVFSRRIHNIFISNIKLGFRRFVPVMKLYFALKTRRYNRPKGIESH